jgi:hypothetical protein
MFDGQSAEDLGCFSRYEEPDTSDVADYLRDSVDDVLCNDCENGPALSYARAFVSDVNWYEIAQHFVDEWNELRQEEEREEEEEPDE